MTKAPLPQEELKDFVEQVSVPLHWVGADGTILWANRAELELLGYDHQEYVGHNITEFHVDQSVIKDILARLTTHETLTKYEARLRCKDGTIRHVAINSSVYRRDGAFIHTRCVTIDITDSRTAMELHERLAAIVESSADAILSKDLNGIIKSWNKSAERIFGYTAAEIIGQPISILAAPDRVDEIPNILDRIKRGERIEHYHTKRRTKDGKIITISLSVSPLKNASGVIIGAAKVARDITEQESQDAALRAANEALTRANADLLQFSYSASHDLQEPLRMVSIYSELLAREFGDLLGDRGKEYLSQTLGGALRMEQLLAALRAYTHASIAGDQPPTAADSEAILDKALGNLSSAIRESNAIITRDTLPPIRLYEFQLEQLFQNLVGNAIRYRSAQPPKIHIAATDKGDAWEFTVQDNGIGIAPAFQEHIFGLFKRLHTVAEYPGTGMGLAICQRIIERAHGRIWVVSETGKGATFHFTIPK